MDIWLTISDTLLSRAKPLETLGLHEIAWSRDDALQVLAELKNRPVAVLGGDVYQVVSGRIIPSFDNWSCERLPGEELQSYMDRSQRAAAAFLVAYPDATGSLFVLVLTRDARKRLSP